MPQEGMPAENNEGKRPYPSEEEKLQAIRDREKQSLKKKVPEKTLEQIRKEHRGKPIVEIADEFLR